MGLRAFTHYFIYILATMKLGESLECYACRSRQNVECGDPFPLGNTSGSMIPFDCMHVRNVDIGIKTAAGALGGMQPQFNPLQTPPSQQVCYKMSVGDLVHRGCSKSDFCQNITGFCEICDTDGCNGAFLNLPFILTYLLPLLNIFKH